MKIVLGRHGRPALRQRKWIAPRNLALWIAEFNDGGILADGIPRSTVLAAEHSQVIVSSPLHRSYRSAQLLAPSRLHVTEELIREAEMPHSDWAFPILPVGIWLFAFRLAWYCGYSRAAESFPAASRRATLASDRLIDLAQHHGSVFVVGHGIMNSLIASRLLELGWSGPGSSVYSYWEYRVYMR